MADKGFLISDLCTPRGVSLIIPPFNKQKKRFLPHVEATKTIANLSIHAEREMERIKNFRILTGVVPITMASQASNHWFGRYVSDSQTSPHRLLKGLNDKSINSQWCNINGRFVLAMLLIILCFIDYSAMLTIYFIIVCHINE